MSKDFRKKILTPGQQLSKKLAKIPKLIRRMQSLEAKVSNFKQCQHRFVNLELCVNKWHKDKDRKIEDLIKKNEDLTQIIEVMEKKLLN